MKLAYRKRIGFILADDEWCFSADELAPLTDPGADAFLARIKKICREPINEVPKVTVGK